MKLVGQLRAALLAAVTLRDMKAVVAELIEPAKGGSVQAAGEVIDRCRQIVVMDDPPLAEGVACVEPAEGVAEYGGTWGRKLNPSWRAR